MFATLQTAPIVASIPLMAMITASEDRFWREGIQGSFITALVGPTSGEGGYFLASWKSVPSWPVIRS